MATQWIDWSKTTRSKNYRGSNSFATFMIIGPVCFFLGILFAFFPYDFPLLWTSAPVPPEYYDQLEIHLKFIHQSPPFIARLLSMVISVGFIGFFVKLFRPSEANVLFDGASLVLYLIGTGIYIANIVQGLRTVSADVWDDPNAFEAHSGPLTGDILLGREDSLKVLSASNTILALVLVGVLILQAGQWYAERREADDYEDWDRKEAQLKQEKEAAAAAAAAGGAGSQTSPREKKKQ
ncbi:Protein csh3 [Sporothrix stenoceras]|uniref:Protein csh3 n=1 Tax=Sporothrix stenoceras TaxID=5173 RepID=A0ABR3Z8W8_9PEZI